MAGTAPVVHPPQGEDLISTATLLGKSCPKEVAEALMWTVTRIIQPGRGGALIGRVEV
jgi:hypothetical protein